MTSIKPDSSRSRLICVKLRQLAALAAVSLGGAPVLAQPAAVAPPATFGLALDGTELTCPPNIADRPDLLAMREGVLRPDPNFKMPLPPGGFQGEAFRKIMADLHEMQWKDWPNLCRYRAANTALLADRTRPDMVLMGDSITENWVAADPGFFAHGFVGRGISGQTSPQMLARFYADVVALHPRVVAIMAGTNDIGGNTGPSLMADYINNINAMIDLAQANRITVILAEIPPITKIPPKPDFDPRPTVALVNAELKAIALRRNLVLVDYFSLLADATGAFDRRYSNEGVHPNRDGYAIMERRLEEAFQTAIGKSANRRAESAP